MKPEPWIVRNGFWVMAIAAGLLFVSSVVDQKEPLIVLMMGFLLAISLAFGAFFFNVDKVLKNYLKKYAEPVDKFRKARTHQQRRKNFRVIKGEKK